MNKMNLSFDGVVSNTFNTVPIPFTDGGGDQSSSSGDQNKRRNEAQQARQSKKLRRNQPNRDGAHQSDHPMTDESMTSVGTLDEFAETLRECTQNLDSYSYLDSSLTRLSSGFQGRSAGPPLTVNSRIRRDGPGRL